VKIKIFIILAAIMSAASFGAAETAEITGSQDNIAQDIAALESAFTAQKKDIADLKKKYESLSLETAEVSGGIKDMNTAIDSLKNDIKRIEESTLEIKNLVAAVDREKARIDEIENAQKKEEESTAGLADEFRDMRGALRERIDRMTSWDDMLSVLKKEIANNEIEVAKIKKTLNDMKQRAGSEDNILNIIAEWPYTGVAALVVSIAAFIAAMIR